MRKISQVYDIESPRQIKDLTIDELTQLCSDIRAFLIDSISKTGGHLSSNLGIVEVTVAMHYVFDSPKDKMIFDVGHQCYTHKILTGRSTQFATLRKKGGLSGYQKRSESKYDCWEAGHSSTSLSAALGYAIARDLKQEDYNVIALIGDGSLTGGMALEALNDIGSKQKKMVIIFNDNNMSISKNYSGVEKRITDIRASHLYIDLKHDVKNNLKSNKLGSNVLNTLSHFRDRIKDEVIDAPLFKEFNLDYMGPVDGHDIQSLIKVFEAAKEHDGPIVVHVLTQKGKGYKYAEQDKVGKWHGVSPFDVATGKSLSLLPPNEISWSQVISNTVMDLAEKDKTIVAITPAMAQGSKLLEFQKRFPDRFFDVGIAEQHAVTFCAGMASRGLKPVFAVYSTFLQRGFDQILHDVAIGNYPVIFGLDRSGLVGADGETHQGIFDIPYLSIIPNMTVMAPINGRELSEMLKHTLHHAKGPTAIKYSRGEASSLYEDQFEELHYGKGQILKEGKEAVIIAVGNIFEEADKAEKILKEEGYEIGLVNPRYIKPFDQELIMKLSQTYDKIMIAEEGVLNGGFGMMVNEFLSEHDYKGEVRCLGIDDQFVEHGSVSELRRMLKIDGESIADSIRQWMKE